MLKVTDSSLTSHLYHNLHDFYQWSHTEKHNSNIEFVIASYSSLGLLDMTLVSFKWKVGTDKSTFLWPHLWWALGLPRRMSDASMTSSCTRLAVWIISDIMAMRRWLGKRPLNTEIWRWVSHIFVKHVVRRWRWNDKRDCKYLLLNHQNGKTSLKFLSGISTKYVEIYPRVNAAVSSDNVMQMM